MDEENTLNRFTIEAQALRVDSESLASESKLAMRAPVGPSTRPETPRATDVEGLTKDLLAVNPFRLRESGEFLFEVTGEVRE